MEVTDLLKELRYAAGPDPRLDDAIRSHLTDNELGFITDWSPTRTRDVAPAFTSSIEPAYKLTQATNPQSTGGCSWEPGTASAKIAQGRFYQASTPELALCIAALVSKFVRTQ